jgi:transketolase C-terminal domain/subunit
MSNLHVTYLVGACSGVIALCVFIALVVTPAMTAFRRAWEKAAVLILSAYVFAALAGLGVLIGAWIIIQWPRWF